jgi:hypothetical protein
VVHDEEKSAGDEGKEYIPQILWFFYSAATSLLLAIRNGAPSQTRPNIFPQNIKFV